MFACVHVCLLVAYLLRKSLTNLAKLFLLAPSWSQDGFRPKNLGSSFSKNPEETDFGGKL